MSQLASALLTNVPASTANMLSYTMLVVVAIFLTSGPIITYYYWRRNRKMRAASATGSV